MHKLILLQNDLEGRFLAFFLNVINALITTTNLPLVMGPDAFLRGMEVPA